MSKVSVVIPLYNHERYIRPCIESVLGQSFRDFEAIVVNDGSTDSSGEIAQSFGEKIRYISQENGGGSAALNSGVKQMQGKYFAWLSSDDMFMPAKLEKQVALLENHPTVDLVYTSFYFIDKEGQITSEAKSPIYECQYMPIRFFEGNFINGSSVVFKREIFDRLGLFDEQMLYHTDANYWMRMLKDGCNFALIREPLLKYRWHDTNLSHHRGMYDYLIKFYEQFLNLFTIEELFPDIDPENKNDRYKCFLRLADVLAGYKLFGLARLNYHKAQAYKPLSLEVFRKLVKLEKAEAEWRITG